MIRKYLKQDILKTILITIFSLLLALTIYITSQNLSDVDVYALPLYLQIYAFLLLPISNDFTYLFIFINTHLYLFILIYLLYLFNKISKQTPIEKYLPISINKYLVCRYTSIILQILFILSLVYGIHVIFALKVYNTYFPIITYTYLTTIGFIILTTIIDFMIKKLNSKK